MKKPSCQEILICTMREMLEKRSFEKLTVQDILAETDISRTTFYKHFACKEQLLIQTFEWLWAQANTTRAEGPSLYGFELRFLHLVCDNASLMKRAWEVPDFVRYLESFFRNALLSFSPPRCGEDRRGAFLAASMTAVLMDVCKRYIEAPRRAEAGRLAADVQRLFTAMSAAFEEDGDAA